ncbi:MAG: YndJ family transporter [Myxococcaceae bacterium]
MLLATFMIPVMNAALVLGVAFVLPVALEARGWQWRAWWAAAVSVAGALWVDAGPLGAALVAPWLALTVFTGVSALMRRAWWPAMVAGFAGTASLALITSRLEASFFDIHEPIVKLTALHFTYAGAGTLSLAVALADDRAARVVRWLVFVAPPVVASGFVTRLWPLQVGGALVMSAGALGVAVLQLRGLRGASAPVRALLGLSSLSPWVAMALGVAWAAAQYWPQVPALTVPDMVPTHGALNAFGFVGCASMAKVLRHWSAQKLQLRDNG